MGLLKSLRASGPKEVEPTYYCILLQTKVFQI